MTIKVYFDPVTSGFYQSDFHKVIPSTAVEITDKKRWELIAGQSEGKLIVADENGRPILQDPPPLTPEQEQKRINSEARAYLAGTDWYVIRQQETGEPVPSEILAERSAARARVIE